MTTLNMILDGMTIMGQQYGMSTIEFMIAYVTINTGFLTVGWFLMKPVAKMIKEVIEG
jgi:hypothetical protein